MKLPHWIRHHWGKWGDPFQVQMVHQYYGVTMGEPFYVTCQRRACETCGLTQRRRVAG